MGIRRGLRMLSAGCVAVLSLTGSAHPATKEKVFHLPPDRVFAAALAVAKRDRQTRVLETKDAADEITFRVDVDEIGPPDRTLGDYWTGLAVRVNVMARGARDSTLHIEVERVYPARFNNVPQRMSPHAEEMDYANRFLARVRSEIRKSGQPVKHPQ
jgi:hypothetical protein